MKENCFFKNSAFGKSLIGILLCFLLQGCSVWPKMERVHDDLTPQSTVIGTPQEEEHFSKEPTDFPYYETAFSLHKDSVPSPAFRALPRRPEVEEEEEEEDSVEDLDASQDGSLDSELEPESTPKFTMYVVKKGDTLSKISKQFHVPIDQIVQENTLKNKNRLSIGQVLVIPEATLGALPFSIAQASIYKVKKGDTLSAIAARNHTTVQRLKLMNHLAGDKIYLGQTLKLSEGEVREGPAPLKADMSPITGDSYTVKAGDSLWTIARRCGLTVQQLKSINHLTSDVLPVDKVLSLVATSPVYTNETEIAAPSPVTPTLKVEEPSRETVRPTEHNAANDFEEEDFEDLIDAGNDIPVSITTDYNYTK